MRPKYQTRANRAEEQVLAMLKSERNIQKPWSLVSCNLENRTLQTTAPEAAIIFNHAANLRPGYEQKEKTVYVPNLFVKLSGNDEAFFAFKNKQELSRRENCFIYDSFQAFPEPASRNSACETFIKEGKVQKEAFLSSDSFYYSFLRREYQELYVDKVNEILASRNDFFIGQAFKLSDSEILSSLCNIHESFFQAFNGFDFQFQPPAVVITNRGKEKPTVKQALTLILLHLLGFDIAILSPDGHADIENLLNPEMYCLFYGDGLNFSKPRAGWIYKLRYFAAGAVIVVALVTSGLLKPGFVFTYGTPPVESTPMATPGVIYQQPDPTPQAGISDVPAGDNAPDIDTPENPVQGTSNSPDGEVKNGQIIEFTDPALEGAIRMVLQKETGDIYIHDLANLRTLRFIGPYAGGEEWHFISGFSPEVYYDQDNIAHREEGLIKDLSDLAKIPFINHLELCWQKKLDLDSLKGLNINSLTLVHDHITDITPLSEIDGLGVLDIGENNVSNISPLAELPLNTLRLSNNSISDISPLANMTELGYLNLDGNPVGDVSVLGKLKNLYSLNLLHVLIDDFSFLNDLTQLTSLNLERTGLSDVSMLSRHTNLEVLILANNNISDISCLKDLKRLETLDISSTNIHDLTVLRELPNLRRLIMYEVKLENESMLNELKNVEIIR